MAAIVRTVAAFSVACLTPVQAMAASSSAQPRSECVAGNSQCNAKRASESVLLQTATVAQIRKDTKKLPQFCSDSNSQIVWNQLCAGWERVLQVGAVPSGGQLCCSSLPAPCRKPSTSCSNANTCLMPSCSQESWYLSTVEAGADEAFGLFGLTTDDFRTCIFESQEQTCGAKTSSTFGVDDISEATLFTLLTLESKDVESTAWEVVEQLAKGPSDGTSLLEQGVMTASRTSSNRHDRSLLERRAQVSAVSDKHRRILDQTAQQKQRID